MIAGLHRQHVPGPKDVNGPGVDAVDQDAALRPGQTGDGMGGEAQHAFEDVSDRGAIFLRRNRVGDGFHRHVLSPHSIPQAAGFGQREKAALL